MLKVSAITSLLVVVLLQTHIVRGDGLAVDFDFKISIDEFVRTNKDNLPYNEKEADAMHPIPFKEGEDFPEFTIVPENTRHRGLVRESRQTQPTTTLDKDFLLLCNRQFLVLMNRNATGVKVYRFGSQANLIACDFDIRTNFMYWSDVNSNLIAGARINGTGLTILVRTNITTPDGIAWDWVNRKLYWTDANERDIEYLDPETGSREVLLTTGNVTESIPRAIVLDPICSNKMYWTDWGTLPRIERASLNGTSRETLHSTNLYWPNALTIDIPTQTLYWADAGLDRIESSSVDGTGRRLLIDQFIRHPFGMDIFNEVFYWTDWTHKAVFNTTINLNTTHSSGRIHSIITNLIHTPMGIKVVSMSKQPTECKVSPQPTCSPMCQNGGSCTSTGVCICATGWRGPNCQEAMCGSMKCVHGTCDQKTEKCSCNKSWSGDTCEQAICFPPDGCHNGGHCAEPGVCNCSFGWTGDNCSKAICSTSCKHGSCTAPDTCTCDPGWTGQQCDIAMCGSMECVHGTCDEKTKKCYCNQGWSGDTCEKAIRS